MNEHETDPEARLRAADPAADVEPRAGFVEEVVAAATSNPATRTEDGSPGDAPDSADHTAPATVTDLDARRTRTRAPWMPIAAIAASIVVFGGAGYAVGAANGGQVGVEAAPPITLQGAAGGAIPEQDAAQDSAQAGVGVAGSEKLAADDMMYPYGSGRNQFSASGLGTSAGSAPGYGYDAPAAANVETVTALAAAVGVEGTPELKDGAWFVGPQDGSGPSLTVGLDGTLSFSFYDPSIDPWSCGTGDGSVGSDGDAVEPEVVEPCEPSGTPPSEAAAIDELRAVITATGRDADAFEYTSQTWEGSVTRTAEAWPVIDGQRVDQAWSAEVSEEGLLSTSGALAEIVPLGDYDIVSEQEAFERLSDPRFGAQMTTLPIAFRTDVAAEPTEEWVAPTEPPAAPTSGTAVSWPVGQVEIVSARLGLATQWQPDGSVLVVPAYAFTDADGADWSVIAVADSMLDFSAGGE